MEVAAAARLTENEWDEIELHYRAGIRSEDLKNIALRALLV